jgi:predicted helicase
MNWSRALKQELSKGRHFPFEPNEVMCALYRPYHKSWLYFDRKFNEFVYQMPKIFPSTRHKNIVISVTGVGANKPFFAIVSNTLPDYELASKGQHFPLYYYEKPELEDETVKMFAEETDAEGYVKKEAISDTMLSRFRERYDDASISKEDIFYYVYGILHSPEYKQRFASDLKKMLPRIPFAKDFRAFSDAGRELAKWHLNYETVEPFPLKEHNEKIVLDPKADYRVEKMVYAKKNGKPDKSAIIYNSHITLSGIPLEAYDYIVNGKSAIDWLMERYQITTDKDSGIKNDPNDWSEDPRYILDLVKRVTRVSLESVKIVESLPALEEDH